MLCGHEETNGLGFSCCDGGNKRTIDRFILACHGCRGDRGDEEAEYLHCVASLSVVVSEQVDRLRSMCFVRTIGLVFMGTPVRDDSFMHLHRAPPRLLFV